MGAFCEDDANVTIKEASNTVECNTIFKWYLKDFAPSADQLPQSILSFLNAEGKKKELLQKMIDKGSVRVEFIKYDWSSSISHSKDFNKSGLKADQYILKSALFGISTVTLTQIERYGFKFNT